MDVLEAIDDLVEIMLGIKFWKSLALLDELSQCVFGT